jgi:hypothetical protein
MKARAIKPADGEPLVEHRHTKGQDRPPARTRRGQLRAQGVELFLA